MLLMQDGAKVGTSVFQTIQFLLLLFVASPKHEKQVLVFFAAVFRHHLTLGRSGGQTVDTRSTSGVPLKSLGYNGSNELCGRSVASKLILFEKGVKNSKVWRNLTQPGNNSVHKSGCPDELLCAEEAISNFLNFLCTMQTTGNLRFCIDRPHAPLRTQKILMTVRGGTQ